MGQYFFFPFIKEWTNWLKSFTIMHVFMNVVCRLILYSDQSQHQESFVHTQNKSSNDSVHILDDCSYPICTCAAYSLDSSRVLVSSWVYPSCQIWLGLSILYLFLPYSYPNQIHTSRPLIQFSSCICPHPANRIYSSPKSTK